MILEKLGSRAEGGNPIRVGVVGAGPFGTSLTSQISGIPGMVVAVLADHHPVFGIDAYLKTGRSREDIVVVESASRARDAFAKGKAVVVPSGEILPECDVEVVFDATGYPESSASVGYLSLQAGKHVVSASAEGDCCVGAILSRTARTQGVTYGLTLGDQPGNAKDLFDYVTALGLEVVCVGKGTTIGGKERQQRRLASLTEHQLADRNLVGALDQSKEQIEAACLANLTGLRCDLDGLHEPTGSLPEIVNTLIPTRDGGILSESGLVDSAACNPPDEEYPRQWKQADVFVIVTSESEGTRDVLHRKSVPQSRDGRYTLLARPWHGIGIEAPMSIARAVLEGDRSLSPLPTPMVEVVTIAKRALGRGEVLDGVGGQTVRGKAIRAEDARLRALLPLGLAQGVSVGRDLAEGTWLTYDDLEQPGESPIWTLRRLQDDVIAQDRVNVFSRVVVSHSLERHRSRAQREALG